MKAIPTTYKKIKFRSRLEARYALFLDTLSIKWFYEYEGFQLSNGKWYLPDFFLPEVGLRSSTQGTYLEIKPTEEKMNESSDLFDHFVGSLVIAVGTPPEDSWSGSWLYEHHSEGLDNYMSLAECIKCHKMKIEFCESNYWTCPYCESETVCPALYDLAKEKFIKKQF